MVENIHTIFVQTVVKNFMIKNNYENIKSLNINGMVNLLCGSGRCEYCIFSENGAFCRAPKNENCLNGIRKWLTTPNQNKP